MWRRASAWRDSVCRYGESSGGGISGDGDGVGVSYQTNVPQALIFVDLRDRQIAFRSSAGTAGYWMFCPPCSCSFGLLVLVLTLSVSAS